MKEIMKEIINAITIVVANSAQFWQFLQITETITHVRINGDRMVTHSREQCMYVAVIFGEFWFLQ